MLPNPHIRFDYRYPNYMRIYRVEDLVKAGLTSKAMDDFIRHGDDHIIFKLGYGIPQCLRGRDVGSTLTLRR